jgi:hypothetical protein
VPMRFHSFAALVLGNFCFSSFFERAHSDFQIRNWRFNHLIHRIATQFPARRRRRTRVTWLFLVASAQRRSCSSTGKVIYLPQ